MVEAFGSIDMWKSETIMEPAVNNGTTRKRPDLSKDTACRLVKNLYGFDVTFVEEFNSYLDRNFHVQVSSNHINPHVTSVSGDGYVLKVLHEQPKKYVEAQHQMQAILNKNGILCPVPVLSLRGQEMTEIKITHPPTTDDDDDDNEAYGVHLVRLLVFIPGRMLCDVPYTPDLLYHVGKFVATINRCLEGFQHEGLDLENTFGNEWKLESAPIVKKYLFAVKDEQNRRLVMDVMEVFERDVIPKYASFAKGVTHGDCSDQNILVRPKQDVIQETQDDQRPHAILDFGCAARSCYVFEIAISTMYIMLENKALDVLETGGYILAGYLTERSLSDDELDVFSSCIAMRYCQSLVKGEYNCLLEPGNEYLLTTAKRGWTQLKMLLAADKHELKERWRKIIQSYN